MTKTIKVQFYTLPWASTLFCAVADITHPDAVLVGPPMDCPHPRPVELSMDLVVEYASVSMAIARLEEAVVPCFHDLDKYRTKQRELFAQLGSLITKKVP